MWTWESIQQIESICFLFVPLTTLLPVKGLITLARPKGRQAISQQEIKHC